MRVIVRIGERCHAAWGEVDRQVWAERSFAQAASYTVAFGISMAAPMTLEWWMGVGK